MDYPRFNKILIVLVLIAVAAGASLALNNLIAPEKLNETNPPAYQLEEEIKPKETSLFFAGDIMLSRNVGTKIFQANDPNLPYKDVKGWIGRADLSFANLESPFNTTGSRVTQGLVFKAEPNTITGLVDSGFDILSTANNHTFDQGRAGLNYTLTWLRENNLTPVGTGADCHEGVIKEVNGIKFGYLAYSYAAYNDGGRIPDPLVCDWNDLEQITTDVIALKAKTDVVIVSSHMGAEYRRSPEPANAAAARTVIDAGADLFIGHHPHWVQTIEEYKGKYIFYSLGNFVFDQMWSEDTMEGLALEVLFKDKNLDKITLLPVVIENYCCPRPADTAETKRILQKINPLVQTTTLVSNGVIAADWQAALSNKGQVLKAQQLDN